MIYLYIRVFSKLYPSSITAFQNVINKYVTSGLVKGIHNMFYDVMVIHMATCFMMGPSVWEYSHPSD